MTRNRGMKVVAAAVIVLALIAAACSGGEFDSGDDSAGELFSAGGSAATAAPGEFAGDERAAPEAPADVDADGAIDRAMIGADPVPAQTVLAVQAMGRDIIFTADITVAVSDVAAAGAEATRIVEAAGGFVFGQQSTGAPQPRTMLVFKVPPASFQDAVARLGEIGELRSQNITADDVTDRIVDLESRITTAVASVERLRALIDQATSVTAIAELEAQLLERETQLETLRGQLRTVRDQVSLATIVVTLTEALSRPQLELSVTAYPGHADAGQSCPGSSSLSVEERTPATLCFEVRNVGDTPLADFELSDPVLGVELDDLLVVFGDPSATLEPGQFMILAAELEPERSLRTQTRVAAAPVDADGTALDDRRVATTATMFLEAIDPPGLPGFSDGLTASFEFLQTIGGFAVLVAGAVIPFVWVLILLALGFRWRRGRGPKPEDAATT